MEQDPGLVPYAALADRFDGFLKLAELRVDFLDEFPSRRFDLVVDLFDLLAKTLHVLTQVLHVGRPAIQCPGNALI
jgi:hypothetical protein